MVTRMVTSCRGAVIADLEMEGVVEVSLEVLGQSGEAKRQLR
jgi:hypothetical protein